MKKLPFLILLIFLISSFKNPLLPPYTLADYDLKGKVKMLVSTSYNVNPHTQEKTHSRTHIYYFSETGLIEKELVFSGKDSTLEYSDYYHYDNDKLKSIEYYEKNDSSVEEFLYNSKNQLIQVNYYENNQLTNERHYKYDSLKNTIKHLDITQNDTSSFIDFYFFQSEDKSINLNIDDYTSAGTHSLYDKDSNCIESKNYYHDNVLYNKHNYKYNLDGLKIQEIRYFERRKSEAIYNYFYQYDENKNLVVFTTKNEKDIIRGEDFYQYDENKNWIIATSTNEHKVITSESYQKIVYY